MSDSFAQLSSVSSSSVWPEHRTQRAFITAGHSGHLTDIIATDTSHEATEMLECDNNNMALKDEQICIEDNEEDCKRQKVVIY